MDAIERATRRRAVIRVASRISPSGLAVAVERADTGPYRAVTWNREDIREIEYASLLHDFGKIGVREHVLIKAKKLYPHDLELIRQRFDFVIRTIEADVLGRKLQASMHGASGGRARRARSRAVRQAP